MTDLVEVAKRIDRIHNAYASLPQFARSTQVKRVMVLLCINELDDALEAAGLSCRLSTGMLVEALNAAADGKRTELFALPSDEVHRSRDDKVHQYFPAAAAALLEAAFTDCLENQGKWAERTPPSYAACLSLMRHSLPERATSIKWITSCQRLLASATLPSGCSQRSFRAAGPQQEQAGMNERYLEDFAVGQTFGSGRLTVNADQTRRSPPRSTHSLSISMRVPRVRRSSRDSPQAAGTRPRSPCASWSKAT
jgi:hypothetical protein